jgi:hypothetical protein
MHQSVDNNCLCVLCHLHPPQNAQDVNTLVKEALFIASYALWMTVHWTLSILPGSTVFNCDMILDIPSLLISFFYMTNDNKLSIKTFTIRITSNATLIMGLGNAFTNSHTTKIRSLSRCFHELRVLIAFYKSIQMAPSPFNAMLISLTESTFVICIQHFFNDSHIHHGHSPCGRVQQQPQPWLACYSAIYFWDLDLYPNLYVLIMVHSTID